MNPEILKAHVCLCVRHAPVCVAATGRRRQVMVVQKKLSSEDFEAMLLGLVAEKLCIRCAMRNGHTVIEAMACDLFSVACPRVFAGGADGETEFAQIPVDICKRTINVLRGYESILLVGDRNLKQEVIFLQEELIRRR